MEDSIFTKIIRGDLPSHKIYEDERTYAFLDIYPQTTGHTLVVPKKQVEFLWDLDDEDYHAVCETARKVAVHLREVLGVPYVGEKVIGIDIPHVHIQLIPFTSIDEYTRDADGSGEPDHGKLAELAARLSL